MAWTTPATWSSNQVVTAAQLNTHIRDNENYLLSRANNQIIRANGSNYTTTSSTFAAIDTTNLSITLTMTTTKVRLILAGVAYNSTAGSEVEFDFFVDGTRVGASYTRGLYGFYQPVNNYWCAVNLSIVTTVSTGSRVFKPVWRTGSNTANFVSDTGNTAILFSAMEEA